MLSGELYRADEELAAQHHRAVRLSDEYNRTSADDPRRRDILEELLGAFGDQSVVRTPFLCDYGSQVHIGARTFINFGLVALDAATITIGDDVQIGPNVQLLTPTHPVDAELRRDKWEAAEPIGVGHNVWLGGGVIVLPGVTIGDDTVVGAGVGGDPGPSPRCGGGRQPGPDHPGGLTPKVGWNHGGPKATGPIMQPPAACTLDGEDASSRLAEWRTFLHRAVDRSERKGDQRLCLRLNPAVEDLLAAVDLVPTGEGLL